MGEYGWDNIDKMLGQICGFHSHGGIQNDRFMMEHPIYKWMRTEGTPISGNLHVVKPLKLSNMTWEIGRSFGFNLESIRSTLSYLSLCFETLKALLPQLLFLQTPVQTFIQQNVFSCHVQVPEVHHVLLAQRCLKMLVVYCFLCFSSSFIFCLK